MGQPFQPLSSLWSNLIVALAKEAVATLMILVGNWFEVDLASSLSKRLFLYWLFNYPYFHLVCKPVAWNPRHCNYSAERNREREKKRDVRTYPRGIIMTALAFILYKRRLASSHFLLLQVYLSTLCCRHPSRSIHPSIPLNLLSSQSRLTRPSHHFCNIITKKNCTILPKRNPISSRR